MPAPIRLHKRKSLLEGVWVALLRVQKPSEAGELPWARKPPMDVWRWFAVMAAVVAMMVAVVAAVAIMVMMCG